jgi:hypothetical protein
MASSAQPDFKELLEHVYKEPDGAKRVEQALGDNGTDGSTPKGIGRR